MDETKKIQSKPDAWVARELKERKLLKESYQRRLYTMGLFETNSIHGNTVVLRVPGGWIFRGESQHDSGCFVPYNNEFQINED